MLLQKLTCAMPPMQTLAPQAVLRQNNLNNRLDRADIFTRSTPAQTGPRFGMLVLSRKKNQSIVIDNGIVITVVDVKDGTVKLGIMGPEGTRADHEEHVKKDTASVDLTQTPAPRSTPKPTRHRKRKGKKNPKS